MHLIDHIFWDYVASLCKSSVSYLKRTTDRTIALEWGLLSYVVFLTQPLELPVPLAKAWCVTRDVCQSSSRHKLQRDLTEDWLSLAICGLDFCQDISDSKDVMRIWRHDNINEFPHLPKNMKFSTQTKRGL